MINRYVVREKMITQNIFDYKSNSYKTISSKFPVIMEEFTLPNNQIIQIPSVLNHITFEKYRNLSIDSSKNINSTICQFMNYVRESANEGEDELFIRLKSEKINGLNLYHLKCFMNYSIDVLENSYDTIKQKENRLFDFYIRLTNLKIIDIEWKYRMIPDSSEKRMKKVSLRPFDTQAYQVHYPDRYRNKMYKENDLSDTDIDLLLRICSTEEFIDIRFAVALGIYGGLRQGEIVNLKVNNIRTYSDENMMVVDINDRPELFAERNLAGSGVKKPRKQVVFNDNGLLYEYFNKHLNFRVEKLSQKNKNTPALFIDRNGNSMTGSTYIYKFYKLKDEFLRIKELENYSDFDDLSKSKWGTHICRGIFTNLCIRRGYATTIEELRNLRGDRSNYSSEPYWNKKNIQNITQQCINVITSCDKYKDDLIKEGAYYHVD